VAVDGTGGSPPLILNAAEPKDLELTAIRINGKELQVSSPSAFRTFTVWMMKDDEAQLKHPLFCEIYVWSVWVLSA
jgi:hypothetical protein